MMHPVRSESSANKIYLAHVDGLRCLAVLLVVLFHLRFRIVPGGFIGVDVFFVISGFLITGICLDRNFSYSAFYGARIRRIIPAYAVVMVLILCASIWLLLPPELAVTAKTIASGALFLQNFYLWKATNYFSSGETDPALHTWSLAVEWQFYLILPLVLHSMRHRPYLRAATLIAMFSVSLLASSWAAVAKPQAAFYLVPFRIFEFLTGSALIWINTRRLAGRAGTAVAWVGLALVLGPAFLFTRDTIFPGAWALVPCVGTAMIIAAGQHDDNVVIRALRQPAVRLIGQASYSIYLVHWPILVFTGLFYATDLPDHVAWGAMLLAVILGLVVWRVVELPFRTWRPPRPRTLYLAGSAACCVVALSGAIVSLTHGLPTRFSPRVDWLADQSLEKGSYRQCLGQTAEDLEGFCRIGKAGATPRFVVWGDSMANALLDGIADAARDAGLAGYYIGTDACPPLRGFPGLFAPSKQRCVAIQKTAASILAAGPIKRLVVAAAWLRYDTFDSDLFRANVTATFSWLQQIGVETTVVGVIPGARANVPLMMARSEQTGWPVDLGIDSARRQTISRLDDFLEAEAKANRFAFARPTTFLCDKECIVAVDGAPIYFDSSHLAPRGSRLLVAQDRVLRHAILSD